MNAGEPETVRGGNRSAARKPDLFLSQQWSGNLNILVVDDNETMRSLLDSALSQEGHQVRQVGGGKKAYEEIGKFEFDLVIMDYDMPDMIGLETIRRLKAEIAVLPPIIIVTAKGSPELVKKCIEAGAKDFIVKPFTVPGLLGRIERYAKQ